MSLFLVITLVIVQGNAAVARVRFGERWPLPRCEIRKLPMAVVGHRTKALARLPVASGTVPDTIVNGLRISRT